APDSGETPRPLPPRNELGQFVREDGEESPYREEEPAAPPTPATPPAASETPTADAPAAEEPDGEPDPALVVELLPRHPHQEPFRLVMDTPEAAETLRANLKGALRRAEFDELAQGLEAERQRVEDDAVAFLLDPVTVVRETL